MKIIFIIKDTIIQSINTKNDDCNKTIDIVVDNEIKDDNNNLLLYILIITY